MQPSCAPQGKLPQGTGSTPLPAHLLSARSNFKALLARIVYINQTVIELDNTTSDSVVNLNTTVNSLDAFYASSPSPLTFNSDIDALSAKLVMPGDTAAMKTNSAGAWRPAGGGLRIACSVQAATAAQGPCCTGQSFARLS